MANETTNADVMFVDDDKLFVDIVCHKLQSEGMTCLFAPDGKAALDMLKQGSKPQLIVLDMLMPVMDGIETLQKLKGNPATSAIPVVVLSNDASPENIQKSKALGVERYLEKIRTDPGEFTAIVKKILHSLASSI